MSLLSSLKKMFSPVTQPDMKIDQIYTGCLAQGAYYITSGGEAVIIDPLREVSTYIDRAEKDGVKIKYIFETHFHADFVSGHLDLAEKTGAKIVFGPTASPKFDAHIATDGECWYTLVEDKEGNYKVESKIEAEDVVALRKLCELIPKHNKYFNMYDKVKKGIKE